MSDIKIGSRVRFTHTDYKNIYGLSVGDTGVVVSEISASCFGIKPDIADVSIAEPEDFWCFFDHELSLVEDNSMPTPEYSCIRVVPPSKPKREIVEGKHSLSNLAQFQIDKKYSDNTVNLSIDKGWNFGAESLREFATILNEIASVLEENKNA